MGGGGEGGGHELKLNKLPAADGSGVDISNGTGAAGNAIILIISTFQRRKRQRHNYLNLTT